MTGKKEDLTRIEDLQEFLHEDLPEEEVPEEIHEDESGGEIEVEEGIKKGIEGGIEEEVQNFEFPTDEAETSAEPAAENEDIAPLTAIAEKEEEKIIKQTEDPLIEDPLADIQQFSTHLTYGQLALGQGPPFAVAIRNIRDDDTRDELRGLLKKLGLDVAQFEQGLALGQILVSQINEYCAIYLAHKLRNLNVDIELGLSESVHLAKNYEDENKRGIPDSLANDQSKEEGKNLRHKTTD